MSLELKSYARYMSANLPRGKEGPLRSTELDHLQQVFVFGARFVNRRDFGQQSVASCMLTFVHTGAS